MKLQEWKIASQEKLNDLLGKKPNTEEALLIASLITIINYNDSNILSEEKSDLKSDESMEVQDYIPTSMIDDKKQESLNHFINYMTEKSKFQTTNIELHDEYAYEYLKKMLKLDEEIIIMIYNSSDKEEKKLINESINRIMDKIK